jgi:hypothetical protein
MRTGGPVPRDFIGAQMTPDARAIVIGRQDIRTNLWLLTMSAPAR